MGWAEAFERALPMGQQAYRDYNDIRLRDADNDRRQEVHGYTVRGLKRKDEMDQGDHDDRMGALREMELGPQAPQGPQGPRQALGGAEAGDDEGMPPASPRQALGGAGVDDAEGMPPAAPRGGLAGPRAPVGAQPRSMNQLGARQAVRGGDFAKAGELQFADAYAQSLQRVRTMKPEEFEDALLKVTADDNVPMRAYPQLDPKTGQITGYAVTVGKPGDKGAVRKMLTIAEMQEIAALDGVADKFPQQAQAGLLKASANVRALFEGQFKQTMDAGKASSEIGLRGAQTRESGARAGLIGQQTQDIVDQRGRREQAAAIQAKWDALSDEQKNGPEGRALEREFNMLNIRNGAAVPLGGGGRGGAGGGRQPNIKWLKNDDGTWTGVSQTPDATPLVTMQGGRRVPFGSNLDEMNKLGAEAAKAGVQMSTGWVDGVYSYGFQGLDEKGAPKWYPTIEDARASLRGAGQRRPTGQQTGQAQPAPANRMDGQKFGLLTPRSKIEEAARAGNPEAIRALEVLQQNEIDREASRGAPTSAYGLR